MWRFAIAASWIAASVDQPVHSPAAVAIWASSDADASRVLFFDDGGAADAPLGPAALDGPLLAELRRSFCFLMWERATASSSSPSS